MNKVNDTLLLTFFFIETYRIYTLRYIYNMTNIRDINIKLDLDYQLSCVISFRLCVKPLPSSLKSRYYCTTEVSHSPYSYLFYNDL